MLTTFQSHVDAIDLDAGHDHRESSVAVPLREVAAIVLPAIGPIEIFCQDVLPMSGIEDIKHPTAVWRPQWSVVTQKDRQSPCAVLAQISS